MFKKQINIKRIFYHIIFWVVLTLFFDVFSSLIYDRNIIHTLISDLLFVTPTDIFIVYFVLYFLIPRFLIKKKYFKFSVLLLIFFILSVSLALVLEYYGTTRILSIEIKHKIPNFFIFAKWRIIGAISLKLMLIGIASTIKLSKIWLISQKKHQKLQKEKIETELKLKESELNFLKSQINPHFLFNALNNLYSLTLEKSDKAPRIVLKISALLDYMLYDCSNKFIDLSKEVESIQNYIEIQEIRFGSEAEINVNIQSKFEDKKIAPLLFLPFIENAFKHGLNKNFGKGNIDIDMQIEENFIKLKVENSISENFNLNENNLREGIGLKNVKKRLELQYKDKYQLDIKKTEQLFIINLLIEIK